MQAAWAGLTVRPDRRAWQAVTDLEYLAILLLALPAVAIQALASNPWQISNEGQGEWACT